VLIYDLEGELFFGAAPELDRYLENFKEKTVHSGIQCLVLRLRRTRNPDMVAIEHLERFLRDTEKLGITVLLAGVRPDLAKILDNARFPSWLPADRIFPEQDEQYSATLNAVRHAYKMLGQNGVENNYGHDKEEVFYYMI
jgi:SulP family sulfate permease